MMDELGPHATLTMPTSAGGTSSDLRLSVVPDGGTRVLIIRHDGDLESSDYLPVSPLGTPRTPARFSNKLLSPRARIRQTRERTHRWRKRVASQAKRDLATTRKRAVSKLRRKEKSLRGKARAVLRGQSALQQPEPLPEGLSHSTNGLDSTVGEFQVVGTPIGSDNGGHIEDESVDGGWEHVEQEPPVRVSRSLLLVLPRIGLSIIGSSSSTQEQSAVRYHLHPREEIAFVTLTHVQLGYSSTERQSSVDFKVTDLQIDNQMMGALQSVALSRSPRTNTTRPCAQLCVVKSQQWGANAGIEHYRYFAALLQELDVSIDMQLLLALSSFVPAGSSQQDAVTVQAPLSSNVSQVDYRERERSGPASAPTSQPLYIELLHFNPIRVNLTFTGTGASTMLDQSRRNGSETRGTTRQMDVHPGFNPMSAIGIGLVECEGADLELNALVLRHLFGTKSQIQGALVAHYSEQVLRQVHVLVGHATVLGNPVGLFTGLADGVLDFFYEPAQGIVKGPEEFVEGLGRGTVSLLSSMLVGAFGAVSKVTGSFGRGFATLSMDKDYIASVDRARRHAPRDAIEGVEHAADALMGGLMEGFAGLVEQPIRGAQQSGAVGLLQGIGKGIVGVAVKPVSGVLQSASQLVQGIANQSSSSARAVLQGNDELLEGGDETLPRLLPGGIRRHRVRLPRSFARNGTIKLFSQDEASAMALLNLHQRDRDSDANHPKLTTHPFVTQSFAASNIRVIVTTSRILALKTKGPPGGTPLDTPPLLVLDVSRADVVGVSRTAERVTLHLAQGVGLRCSQASLKCDSDTRAAEVEKMILSEQELLWESDSDWE